MKRAVIADGRRLEYILVQTSRRDVLFKALPGGEVRVYAPAYMRLRELDELVRERAGALREMGRRLDEKLEQDRLAHPVGEGCPILIEGERRALRLAAGKRVSGELAGGEYRLTLPQPDLEEAVRAALRAALSRRALERIRGRLALYAPRIGVGFGRVTIREQKSRWGSCSARGNLSFNWKLIMAPPEALDYVVIHELCHRLEFNHSPRFWQLVEAQMPEYEAWKKWLKTHTGDLSL